MAMRYREVCDLILYELYWLSADTNSELYDIAPNDLPFAMDGRVSDTFFRNAIEKLAQEGFIERVERLPDTFSITRRGMEYVDEQLDNIHSFLFNEHQLRPSDYSPSVPAAARFVELDHNSNSYKETIRTGEQVIEAVRASNEYANADKADQEQRLAELNAGYSLLRATRVDKAHVKSILIGVLAYLAAKFADEPIGELAKAAWEALKILIGF